MPSIARPNSGRKETQDHFPTQITQGRSHYHGLATMNKRDKTVLSKAKLTRDQIDQVVIAQADDSSASGKAVVVKRAKSASLSIPSELAARAAFLATLHRESGVDKWVERVVRERVEIEESAFTAAKKTLAS